MPPTLRRRWTLFLLLAATLVLAWLDLGSPDGVYAWAFVSVVLVCTLLALRGAEPAFLAGGPGAASVPRAATITTRGFFKESLVLGLTGFGGGLAVLSQIEQRLVQRRRLVPIRKFLETAAIAQGLPGAAGANTLALIGYDLGGVPAAVAGAAGFVLPSFLMLMIAALLYPRFRDVAAVDGIFRGLDPAVAALVFLTAVRLGSRLEMGAEGPRGWQALWRQRWDLATAALAGLAVAWAGIGVVEVILVAGLLGVVRTTVRGLPDPSTVFENRWRWFRRRVAQAARFGARAIQVPWWRRLHDPGEDDLLSVSPWILFALPFVPAIDRLSSLGPLATVFLRAGAVTFGGGFVMIPLLELELVQVHRWLSPSEFADAVALGQVTPGPVMITATFVGSRMAGVMGALVATFSVFAPAWLLALAVGTSVRRLRGSPAVQAFLNGIQPAVVGLMFAAAVAMARHGIQDWMGAFISVTTLMLLRRWRLHPLPVLLGAAIVGIVWRFIIH
ncbi:MAG TPA: chromate efflux transporter [Candidatus Eisenbacteria bacterium]|nr:chromate efflux transporter [Candidatus Eisenbacteria bacterium]